MQLSIKLQFNSLTFLIAWNSFMFFLVILAEILFGVTEFTNDDITLFGGIIIENQMINNIGTLITSSFLHFGLFHFLVNMYSLYRIGQIVETFYDGKKLFITYIIGGLSASVLTALWYISLDSSIASVGASGAIFALIGLLIGGTLKQYRYGYQLPFSFNDVFFVALLALSVGLLPGTNINNLAHIGGLMAGTVLGLLFKHSLGAYETSFEKKLVSYSFTFSQALFIVSYIALILGIIYL